MQVLQRYTSSQWFRCWEGRSVFMERMSFERTVSGSPGLETMPKLRLHRPWSRFYCCHPTVWPHVRVHKPAETHSKQGHAVNKPWPQLSKILVGSRISWTSFTLPAKVSGNAPLLSGKSFHCGHVHCCFWLCMWIKARETHEYCMIFIKWKISEKCYFSNTLRAMLI